MTILLLLLLPRPTPATHTLRYLGPLDGPVDTALYSPAAGDCILGNRRPAVQYAEETGTGVPPYVMLYPDGHSTGFFPWDGDCPCTLGYYFTDIHLVFANISETPVDFAFRFDLAAGAPQGAPMGDGLTFPWTEDQPTLYVGDTAPQAGYYELAVCTTGWRCAELGYAYGLTVMSYDPGELQPSLRFALDGAADNALPDLWWYHIAERILATTTGFPGDIIMWADVICCEFAVPDETTSWSEIKKLYR